MGNRPRWRKKRKLSREDVRFLTETGIFQAVPEHALSVLLACMAPVNVKAGERFIQQGTEGNSLYLIQDGVCAVVAEKDGVETPVARRKSGDLIGEMALCTGEKRTAHIYAETDMKLWRMTRAEFDQMCLSYPGLSQFITEIVTNRITASKFVPHRTIGKYVITNVIGEGGWGIVYRGVHPSLNMPVAVKMLKHNMAMDPDFSQKFRDEATIIAGLKHDNIVRVYDIEHLYRTVFIVMEYLSGISLEYMLENMPKMSFTRALHLLIQISRGLLYAHRQGIVHQDVKPANIFVEADDRVKIVDFGLAVPTGTEDDEDMPGTPYYMAPEQIKGEPVDARTDIYSFGITAFELCTGRKPFIGPDVGDILLSHTDRPVPDPSSLNPDLPPEFTAFIQRATRKDPSQRYENVERLLEDLLLLAERHGLSRIPRDKHAHKIMSMLMLYREQDRRELARLVEEFSRRVKELGAEVRIAHYED